MNGLSSDYGVPGHDHESVDSTDADSEHADEQGVKIEADELRVDLKGALNTDSSTIEQLKFSLGIFDYRHKELEDTEVASRFKNQGVDSRFEVLHDFALEHTGVSGVTFKHTELEALGEESFIVPTDTTEPGVFTFHKFSLSDRLDYDLGGRVELVQHDPEVLQNRNFVPFSLATGPTWKLMSDQSYLLGLALAYSERAPAASELYASGAHLARQIYEQGDQRLGEESSIGADLTVRKNSGTITGSATSFVQKFKDYINLVADGTEREGLPVYNYQGSAALFWGFELETSTALHDLFRLTGHELYFDLQFDYVRARDTDNSENIPRVQPVRTIARIRQIHKSFNTTLEAVFAEAQNWTAPFELETGSYQLLNVDLEVPVYTESEQRVALFVNGTNLTDDEARLHTSFIKDLAPMRGRAVLAGIRAIF